MRTETWGCRRLVALAPDSRDEFARAQVERLREFTQKAYTRRDLCTLDRPKISRADPQNVSHFLLRVTHLVPNAAQIRGENILEIHPTLDHRVGTIVLGMIVPIRYKGIRFHPRGPSMTNGSLSTADRRGEAERLISLARGLLIAPNEEVVVNFLDHAIEALQIVIEHEEPVAL